MSGPVDNIALYCPACGYNLTGLTNNVCPECGGAFDPAELERRARAKRPHFITGVLLLFIAPTIAFAALPIFDMLDHFGVSRLLHVGSGGETAFVLAYAGVGIVVAVATSIIVGRRLARRLARRNPGDPPTPTTIGVTIAFALLFLVTQALASACAFFLGCLGVVATGGFR